MSKKNKNQAQDCTQAQDNTQQEQKKNNNNKQQSDQMRSENSRNR